MKYHKPKLAETFLLLCISLTYNQGQKVLSHKAQYAYYTCLNHLEPLLYAFKLKQKEYSLIISIRLGPRAPRINSSIFMDLSKWPLWFWNVSSQLCCWSPLSSPHPKGSAECNCSHVPNPTNPKWRTNSSPLRAQGTEMSSRSSLMTGDSSNTNYQERSPT